jgi:hypothetical protein
VSRQLKRQISRANGGRGAKSSPARPRVRTPEQRMNRILLFGGSGLAVGAIAIAVTAPHFNPVLLGINLAAIAIGLLMGKFIGKFMFRRVLPTARNK